MFAPDANGGSAGSTPGLPTLQVSELFNMKPIPDGDEIYDTLMAQIEPELTSDEVGGLKAKYADETPEEKQERAARYERSFAEYERRFAAYCSERNGSMQRAKAEALKSLEDQERAQDDSDMASLESQMLSA